MPKNFKDQQKQEMDEHSTDILNGILRCFREAQPGKLLDKFTEILCDNSETTQRVKDNIDLAKLSIDCFGLSSEETLQIMDTSIYFLENVTLKNLKSTRHYYSLTCD